jgi:FkbM family methyltransferase
MSAGKELVKVLILKASTRRFQQRLRFTYLTHRVSRMQGYREPEMDVLKSLVHAGFSVADVGANVGAYTVQLAILTGASGKVYAFEPILENYEILESVVRKARLLNVSTFRAALGSNRSQSVMVIPNLGFAGYYWAHFARAGDSGRQQTVDVFSLDDLWKKGKIPRLDFIKCDVEGSELEVIRGALELVQSQFPGWLLEVSRETSNDLFGILKDLGYRAFVYDKQLVETDVYRDKEFSNYFFLHPKTSGI